MRRLAAGLAGFGLLCALAGCADPAADRVGGSGVAVTTAPASRPPAAPVKQRDSHLSGSHVNLAVYYPRTRHGRRYLAPEWHPVPYTRAMAAAAVSELLDGEPYCPGSQRPFPAGAHLRADEGAGPEESSGPADRPERTTSRPCSRRVLMPRTVEAAYPPMPFGSIHSSVRA